MSVTSLFPDPVSTLSVLEGEPYHDPLHLPLERQYGKKYGCLPCCSSNTWCASEKY